jgi:hypothetical protein
MGSQLVSAFPAHRVAERFVAHGPAVSFRELCSEVLTSRSRYLVLDLDGTVHFRRNLGELLGWELSAYMSYGLPTMERLEPRRRSARWLVNWSNPRQLAEYMARAAVAWAVPGLRYWVWSKVASRHSWLRRAGFRKFRTDPIRPAQQGVQTTLMDQIASVSPELVPVLMERLWERHRGDQVITAADIAWIRQRFPNANIVLSSASPQQVVTFAAERLGIEHAHGSTPDRINSGEAKIEMLKGAFVDFGEPGVEVVGISDTAHGDDHCWTQHFTKVVDINSPAPFPPIVPVGSPLEEVHSATVLSRHELERRASDPMYQDSRRGTVTAAWRRELAQAELVGLMESLLERFNDIARSTSSLANPGEAAYRLSVLRESSRACLA